MEFEKLLDDIIIEDVFEEEIEGLKARINTLMEKIDALSEIEIMTERESLSIDCKINILKLSIVSLEERLDQTYDLRYKLKKKRS